MSITDELREYAEDWDWVDTGAEKAQDRIEAIADRIDAEHEEAIASMMNDALYHANDKDMADLGWVKLPKDADGEYIHVGDVLTDGEYTFRVDELAAFGDGSWSIRNEDGNAWAACDVTHHHTPTVEDVLREFALAVCKDDALTIRKDVVDEYAAKLQLREDA